MARIGIAGLLGGGGVNQGCTKSDILVMVHHSVWKPIHSWTKGPQSQIGGYNDWLNDQSNLYFHLTPAQRHPVKQNAATMTAASQSKNSQ